MSKPKKPPCLPDEATFVWSQDNDSCDSDKHGQYLTVKTADAGGGNYVVIETTRWAIDADGIDEFAASLKWALRQCKEGADEGGGGKE